MESAPARAVPPYPAASDLDGAPECVLALVEHRRCVVEGHELERTYSCNLTHEWRDKVRGAGFIVPGDLTRAWDAPLDCTVQLDAWDESIEQALVEVGFRLGTRVGAIASGTLPLGHAFCLSAIERVRAIECEEPGPTLQTLAPATKAGEVFTGPILSAIVVGPGCLPVPLYGG